MTTTETPARTTNPSTTQTFGYIGQDGKFVGGTVTEPSIGAQTPGTLSEQSAETNAAATNPPDTTDLPDDPRELISMAFYVNVSPLGPNLYLGNLQVARSTRYRTEHKISHIVSVCTEPVPADWPESGQKQLRIPIQDLDHEDLLIWMPRACHFIEESLREGGTVLIHSERGQSRSAAIAAAYFMYKNRIGATEALELVRKAREQIWVKPGFQEQLVLFAICQYEPGPHEAIYRNWRARLDQALARLVQRQSPH